MEAVVSVIMSVFKEPQEYLKHSIDSILTQSFKDFEFIIICDNPSDKNICNFLKVYKSIDYRIKLVINPTNMGLTKSLNIGLKLASGKYIARMDADDICMHERLYKQVAYLENNPEISVCGTNRYYIVNDKVVKKYNILFEKNGDIVSTFLLRSPFTHPSVMFRTILVKEGWKYNENFECAQDYELWSRMILSGLKMGNVSEPLIYYRVSSGQISCKKNAIQIECAKRIKKNILKSWNYSISDSELSLLVLPYQVDAIITTSRIKKFGTLVSNLGIVLDKNELIDRDSFDLEVLRTLMLLCSRSTSRISSFLYCLTYKKLSYNNLKEIFRFIISRIV